MSQFEIQLLAERLREIKTILESPEDIPNGHRIARAERSSIIGRLYDAKTAQNAAK